MEVPPEEALAAGGRHNGARRACGRATTPTTTGPSCTTRTAPTSRPPAISRRDCPVAAAIDRGCRTAPTSSSPQPWAPPWTCRSQLSRRTAPSQPSSPTPRASHFWLGGFFSAGGLRRGRGLALALGQKLQRLAEGDRLGRGRLRNGRVDLAPVDVGAEAAVAHGHRAAARDGRRAAVPTRRRRRPWPSTARAPRRASRSPSRSPSAGSR